MVTRGGFRGVRFVHGDVSHTVAKDLELRVDVNEEAAEQTVADNVHVNAVQRDRDLMNGTEKKGNRRRVVVR